MAAQTRGSFRAALARRWQIPALFLSAGLFAAGVMRVAIAHRPASFEEELARVKRLGDVGALTRAHSYLVYLLRRTDRPDEQRAELHRLLAGTIYQAESRAREHNPDNLQAVVANFRAAGELGGLPNADDLVALGLVHEWMDSPEPAAEAYRSALGLGVDRSGWASGIRRRLIALEMGRGAGLSPEALAELEAIISDERAAPDALYWAIEQKVHWLLDQSGAAAANALVAAGRERLAGTAEWIALSYPEALCLRELGRHEEAEAALRSLRNNWTQRDDLWGKAGWLLGFCQQQDGRPQTALSFYEEVLTAFRSGELHDACEFGRAECLAALGRYDRALEVFTELGKRFAPSKVSGELAGRGSAPHSVRSAAADGRVGTKSARASLAAERSPVAPLGDGLDGSVLRTAITTIGEARLQEGDLDRGLRFVALALSLTPDVDREQKARHLSRMAAGYAELARRMISDSGDPGDPPEAGPRGGASSGRSAGAEIVELFAKAADSQVRLFELQVGSEQDSADALELAADYFDAAGQTDRVIETLHRLIARHPTATNRVTALYALGTAHQARQDYAAAAAAFSQAIDEYPRLPHALASMVPLAECLLGMGGEHVRRGVERLEAIVDDRGRDPLFSPGATEYRQALLRLADYYVRAEKASVPDHLEKAIARLEDALALYPDDPEAPRLRFQLAEVYRLSSQAIRENKTAMTDGASRREAERRMRAAHANYTLCRGMLARRDASSLDGLEQTYLRNSYLYVGDCLFDLGELDAAVEAYREAAWRYENEPAAASASLQVVHCYRRLGKADESRAALGRLQWLLKKIPESAFDAQLGMSPKRYWEQMAVRIESASARPDLDALSAGAESRSTQ